MFHFKVCMDLAVAHFSKVLHVLDGPFLDVSNNVKS